MPHNKKRGAIALQTVGSAILLLVILFVVTNIIGTQTTSQAGRLLGIAKEAAKSLDGEFVPYTEEYTSEEEIVLNSLNALELAIEKTASLGENDKDYTKINSNFKELSSQISIPKKQTIFKESEIIFKKNFCIDFLKQNYFIPKTKEELSQIIELSIFFENCYKKNKQANTQQKALCGIIDVSEIENIHQDEIKNFLESQKKDFKVDVIAGGFGWGVFTKSDIDKDEGDQCVYYKDNKIIVNKAGRKDCQELLTDSCPILTCTKDTCKLKGFELPQDLSEGKTAINDWITNAMDPKYIVYYESFPIGEDGYWKITATSFMKDVLLDVMILGGALNIVPEVGKIGKALIKPGASAIKTLVKEVAEESTEKLTVKFGSEIGEKTLKKAVSASRKSLYKAFTSGDEFLKLAKRDMIGDIVNKNIKGGITGTPAKELYEAIFSGKFSKESLESALKKAAKSPKSTITDDIIENILKQSDEILEMTAKKALAKYSRRQAIKKFFQGKFLDVKDQLVKDSFEKMFLKEVNENILAKLPKKAQEQFLERMTEYADEIIEGGIKGLTPELMQKEASFAWEMILDAPTETIAQQAKKGFELSISQFASKIKDPKAIKDLLLGTGGSGYKFPLQIPLRWAKIGPVKIPWAVKPLSAAYKTTVATITDAKKLFIDSRLGKYGAALAIGHQLALMDSINEKLKPQGKDNLILFQPFFFQNKLEFKLDNVDYMINLETGRKHNQRLFFASPCKVDLIFKKGLSSCTVSKKDYIYKGIPIQKGTIDIYPGDYKRRFIFREIKGKEQDEFARSMISCLIEPMPMTPQFDAQGNLIDQEIKTIGEKKIKFDDGTEMIVPMIALPDCYPHQSYSETEARQFYNTYGDYNNVKAEDHMDYLEKQYMWYYEITGDVDDSLMVKQCKESQQTTTEGILESSRNEMKITIPSIIVEPDFQSYGSYNNGVNYCFSGNHNWIKIASVALTVVNIALDIVIGTASLGIAVPALFVTGAATAAGQRALEKLKDWPNH